MSKPSKPLYMRRWVWWTVAALAVFLVGVAAGASGRDTYAKGDCAAAAGLIATAPIAAGGAGV